jgi:Fur family peroxide stress response transcriptional regulator
VEGSGDAKRFDGGLDEHQHFKCVKCKRVIDFFHEPFKNIEVPQELEEMFVVLRKSVYLEGICDLCR